MSFTNRALYSLDDSSEESSSEEEDLLLSLQDAAKPLKKSNVANDLLADDEYDEIEIVEEEEAEEEEETEGSGSGWSSSEDSTSHSHSNVELDDTTAINSPSLVAKGRLESLGTLSPKAKDKKKNADDTKLKKNDVDSKMETPQKVDAMDDGDASDLELLLQLRSEEKKERDEKGKTDEQADRELEQLQTLVDKSKTGEAKKLEKVLPKEEPNPSLDQLQAHAEEVGLIDPWNKKHQIKSAQGSLSSPLSSPSSMLYVSSEDSDSEPSGSSDYASAMTEERRSDATPTEEEPPNNNKSGLFGSFRKNKKTTDAGGEGETEAGSDSKKRRFLGSLRRSRSKSFDEEMGGGNDDGAERDETPKKRGLFGSFRRSNSKSMDEEMGGRIADDDDDEVNSNELAGSAEEVSNEQSNEPVKKRGLFSSFRRNKSKSDLSEPPSGEPEIVVAGIDQAGEIPSEPEIAVAGMDQTGPVDVDADGPVDVDADGPVDVDAELGELPTDDELEQGSAAQKNRRGFLGLYSKEPDSADSPGKSVQTLVTDDLGDADSPMSVEQRDHDGSSGGDSVDDSQASKKKDDDSDYRPIRWKRLLIVLTITAVIIIAFSFGTAYWGTNLAVDKSDTIRSIAEAPTAAPQPTAAPTPFSECSNRQNALIEVTLTFDSKPAEVGLSLRDSGRFGTSIWRMEEGSFRSFSQFQRENVFSICLSSVPTYEFEITDSLGNGLISSFGDTKIYGGWDLLYDRETVVSYRGDCNATRTEVPGLTNSTHLPCGEYCRCSYTMRSNGTVGECITDCTVPP